MTKNGLSFLTADKEEIPPIAQPNFYDENEENDDEEENNENEGEATNLDENQVNQNGEVTSLYAAGLNALSNVPQDKVINAAMAVQTFKEALSKFLEPFAQEGKVVTKEDINRFKEDFLKERNNGL